MPNSAIKATGTVTTRSDLRVRLISAGLVVLYGGIGLAGVIRAEPGLRLAFAGLLLVVVIGAAVWTRRVLFRRTTVSAQGIDWRGLFERGHLDWAQVTEVNVNRGPLFGRSRAIDFSRIEFCYERPGGRRARFIAASYSRTPISLASEIVKLCPDPEKSALLARQIVGISEI